MKAFQITTSPAQPPTDPFRQSFGITLALRGGDICHPLGVGDWFKPPYFKEVFRFWLEWPIAPYITWRVGNCGGYIGAKIYGVDSEAYRNWLPPSEVYVGSLAMMFSIRLWAKLNPEQ